jgi:uncharacterized protein YjgD (DUF1641 family)
MLIVMKNRDINRLAGHTGVSRPSIYKWLKDPDSVQAGVRFAIECGIKQLKLEATSGLQA